MPRPVTPFVGCDVFVLNTQGKVLLIRADNNLWAMPGGAQNLGETPQGGGPKTSEESNEIGWFLESELPPLSDGHDIRIKFGFAKERNPEIPPFFE